MQTFHFFRPVFTQRLLQRLQQGHCVTLVGKDTEGASRLVQDIAQSQLEEVGILEVDLAVYQKRYADMVADLSQQMGLPTAADDFQMVIEVLQLHGSRSFLMINHVDRLWEPGTDVAFDEAFFQTLHSISLIPSMGLLLVSDKPLSSMVEQASWASWDTVKLPPIGYKRIKEELLRTSPHVQDWHSLAQPIFAHPKRYLLLEYVIAQLQQTTPAELAQAPQLMQSWLAAFAAQHGERLAGQPAPKKPWWKRMLGN